ncbi:serine hydrolase domain-containing protein [Stenotrophomonas mori]|nr:serine hydrolase domain-containing protein [Stenotrophomonas mori]
MAVLALALFPLGGAHAQPPAADASTRYGCSTASTVPSGDAAARLEAFSAAMRAQAVPGAQLAYAGHGRQALYCHGVAKAGAERRVDDTTLFQAASLSKVVGAYIALRLVDQGLLDLDTPLWSYWPSERTRDNPQARTITARMALNHTSGLPNWEISPSNPAIDQTPLRPRFTPGTRFAYSGEGFYLLQRTIEHLTGRDWNTLAAEEVFSRMDMPDSSFVTDPEVAGRHASGHAGDGTPEPDRVFGWGNTAWTLVTTAHDYGNFVHKALYRGEGLQPATRAAMFTPSSDAADPAAPNAADPFIAWGLGVGLQDVDGRQMVWHWGDNPGFKALFMLDPASGESLVLLTNSENGPATYKQVLATFMGEGRYPAVDWSLTQD